MRRAVIGLVIAGLLIPNNSAVLGTGNEQVDSLEGEITNRSLLSDSLTISNAQLIYNSPFDVQAFLESRWSPLMDYEAEFSDGKQTAAEIIEFYAQLYSLNPKVILTLIQLRAKLLDERPASLDELASPLKQGCDECTGFAKQIFWASELLALNYYNYPHENHLVFADGQEVTAPSEWNAGTFAVAALLASGTTAETLGSPSDGELGDFRTIYTDSFGSPFASTVAERMSYQAAMPTLKLPWTAGEYWYFTGGPHHEYGYYEKRGIDRDSPEAPPAPWSALDFSPPGHNGCEIPKERWVVAAAGGKVVLADNATVKIDHDGDGNAGTGWVTSYRHLATIQVAEGQTVSSGSELGHPSCEDCSGCTGSHVHFSTLHDGQFQEIKETVISGWIVHETSYYNGEMVKGTDTKEADEGHSDANRLLSDNGLENTVSLSFTAQLSHAPDDDQSAEVEVHVFRFITLMGPELMFHGTVTTDNYGNYSGLVLPGVAPGVYDVYVKPAGYLRRGATGVQLSADDNYIDFSNDGHDKLVAGDIDIRGGDNLVNSLDLGVWCRDWCLSEPCPDSLADFNRDGVVNSFDYLYIQPSWFEEGDGWTAFPDWSGIQMHDSTTDIPSRTSACATSEKTARVETTPSSSNISVGETVDVYIRIDGNDVPLDAVDVIVEYDSCTFEVQEVSASSVLNSMSYEVNAASNLIHLVGDFGIGSTYVHDGFETLATITFRAVASPESGVTDVQAAIVSSESAWQSVGTLDSNAVKHDVASDVISGGSFDMIWVGGTPVRSSPVVTLIRPTPNSYINQETVQLSAEVGGECNYANYCRFAYRPTGNGNWVTIAGDDNVFDGWGDLWDLHGLQDGVYDVKAIVGPWAGSGAYQINSNVTIDRTPPRLESVSFSPSEPSDANTVEIHVQTSDNVAGVDHITAYHYGARDGSTSGDLVYIGTITASSGVVPWDISQLPNGEYRVVFQIGDRADNWDFWTDGNQPTITYHINRSIIFLPLALRNMQC